MKNTQESASAKNDLAKNAVVFTSGPVHKHLVKLTGFMVLGLISIMGASLIEAVYIGNLGTEQLAALSFTFPLVMIFQGMAMGLGIGASSVVARTMGLGDRDKIKLLVTHCFILVITLSVLFSAVAYNYIETFFLLLGVSETILPLSVNYMQIWLYGLPFFTVAMVGSTIMRATGDASTPGYLMAIGSALIVIISPFFIFGLMGAPELGLSGAAIGFVVARIVSFLMYAYVLAYRDKLISLGFDKKGSKKSGSKASDSSNTNQSFASSCYDILHVGLPAIASNMIMPLLIGFITRLLAQHGTAVVAGFGVASRIESMLMMVLFSLAMSTAPFIGQNWGAKKFDRVKLALKLTSGFAIIWGIFAYLLLFIFANTVVSAINSDPAVVEAAVNYLLILPLGMGFIGLIAVSTSIFNALGKPMPPLIISFSQMIVINIPLALLGNYLWGYIGIFISGAFTAILVGGVSWLWVKREIESGATKLSPA